MAAPVNKEARDDRADRAFAAVMDAQRLASEISPKVVMSVEAGDAFYAAALAQRADLAAREAFLWASVVREYAPATVAAKEATHLADDARRYADLAIGRARDAELVGDAHPALTDDLAARAGRA